MPSDGLVSYRTFSMISKGPPRRSRPSQSSGGPLKHSERPVKRSKGPSIVQIVLSSHRRARKHSAGPRKLSSVQRYPQAGFPSSDQRAPSSTQRAVSSAQRTLSGVQRAHSSMKRAFVCIWGALRDVRRVLSSVHRTLSGVQRALSNARRALSSIRGPFKIAKEIKMT